MGANVGKQPWHWGSLIDNCYTKIIKQDKKTRSDPHRTGRNRKALPTCCCACLSWRPSSCHREAALWQRGDKGSSPPSQAPEVRRDGSAVEAGAAPEPMPAEERCRRLTLPPPVRRRFPPFSPHATPRPPLTARAAPRGALRWGGRWGNGAGPGRGLWLSERSPAVHGAP